MIFPEFQARILLWNQMRDDLVSLLKCEVLFVGSTVGMNDSCRGLCCSDRQGQVDQGCLKIQRRELPPCFGRRQSSSGHHQNRSPDHQRLYMQAGLGCKKNQYIVPLSKFKYSIAKSNLHVIQNKFIYTHQFYIILNISKYQIHHMT